MPTAFPCPSLPRRIWLAALLLPAVPVPVAAEAGMRTSIVDCAAGRSFRVRLDERRAVVLLEGRSLELARRPSSLGVRYASDAGALMIDGSFVAFVLMDDIGFDGCRLTPLPQKAEGRR